MSTPTDDSLAGIRLDQLSTHVSTLRDAERFVFRYGNAIRGYLNAILRDPADAEEVLHELILSLLRRGGASTWPGKGRFRDYLKTAARNAAITHLRKRSRRPVAAELEIQADPSTSQESADRLLTSEWQRCVLGRVWRELEAHERRAPGNLCFTVLQIVTEFPEEDSPSQARIATERAGRALTAEAFRKQVSRARLKMAELILLEVGGSIASPTADEVEGELRELGLWTFVADHLPEDWRTRFFGG
jgi:RNA polymerase sigma-70 factor (ECF subfamily)